MANHGKQECTLDIAWRRAVSGGQMEAGGGKLLSTVTRTGRPLHRVRIPVEDVVVLGVKRQ
jgi:hypothetical protein